MDTLLQKALNIKVTRPKNTSVNAEQKELALAWATGKVRLSQAAKALDIRSSATSLVYSVLARG